MLTFPDEDITEVSSPQIQPEILKPNLKQARKSVSVNMLLRNFVNGIKRKAASDSFSENSAETDENRPKIRRMDSSYIETHKEREIEEHIKNEENGEKKEEMSSLQQQEILQRIDILKIEKKIKLIELATKLEEFKERFGVNFSSVENDLRY